MNAEKAPMETDILYRKLEGNLTPAQEREFDGWLASSPAHRAYFERLRANYPVADHILTQASFESYRGQFAARLVRRRHVVRRRILLAGAAAAVALAVVIPFTRRGADSVPEDRGERVSLVTSGGEVLTFSELVGRAPEIGATVDADNGIISFGPADGDDEVRHELIVERGGFISLALADGTKVWVNSGSRLTFPRIFGATHRTVQLDGEAYFEVSADSLRPFEVVARDGVGITVLGTKFNVRSYGGHSDTEVTLLEGSVAVTHEDAKVLLSPNQQAQFDHTERRFTVPDAGNAAQYTAWVGGMFDFDLQPLGEIFDELERWYDVEITCDGARAAALGPVTLQASRGRELADIMKILEKIAGLEYSRRGSELEVRFPR